MPYSKSLRRLLFVALILASSTHLADAASRYEIIATFDPSGHRLSGAELIFFDNTSDVPLTEIDLFLYPNIYLEKGPFDKAGLTDRAYPKAFNPGQMTLASVEDKDGRTLFYLYDKSFIIVRVFLHTPIAPGERGRLRVLFSTLIPEKWGVFGHFRNQTYLQGGWHPFLVPLASQGWDTEAPLMRSGFEILLTLDQDLAVVSSGSSRLTDQKGRQKVLLLEGEGIPFFTLVIERGDQKSTRLREGVEMVYSHFPGDKEYADQLLKLGEEVVDFFTERYGKPELQTVQMVEVQLYQDLVSSGEGVLFVSSRILKVFPKLEPYHEASVARGILFELWKRRLTWENEWVAEAMADRDVETYLLIKYGGETSLERILRPIAFLPVIDQVIYSKDLPLRKVYFKEALAPLFNEDIRFFWVHRPSGGDILAKLTNLLGQETIDRVMEAYLLRIRQGRHPALVSVSQEVSGEYLEDFYAQWLHSNPAIDFGLEGVKQTALGSSFRTTIEISKKGAGVEPLKIRVLEENGNEMVLVWDGRGDRHEETLVTPAPVAVVELDPDGEVNDPDRFNNRYPHLWKVLLNDIGVGYDFQTHRISYGMELGFQRVYDNRNIIIAMFNHDDLGTEGTLSYTHVLESREAITASLGSVQRLFSNGESSSAGVVGLSYQFSYPAVPLTTEFIQRITGTVPLANIQVAYLQAVTSGFYDYSVQTNVVLRRIFTISHYHAFAARAYIGESVGGLFDQNRYFLGGDSGMRGYTPLALGGNNIALFSFEYRFPLFYETGTNIFGLALTHAIQGAIFSDAGMVTDSHNVFQFGKYDSDFGASLRVFYDFFGFFPTLLRFDLAYPIDSPLPSERIPHYYLSAGQPF